MGFTSELDSGLNALQRALSGPGVDPALGEQVRQTLSEDMPEAIGFIRTSSARMDRLIKAIPKLSREGRRALRSEAVDLKAIAEAALAAVAHRLDATGTRATIEGTLPTIVTDRLALEQILGNLIDNAAKYLVPGRPGRIRILGEAGSRRIRLTVEDNGRGIATQDRERIFELFRRAGAQDQSGEGIGLAHVRALSRRLGGDVTVHSVPGEGSASTLELPRVLTQAALAQAEAAAGRAPDTDAPGEPAGAPLPAVTSATTPPLPDQAA